MSNKKILSTSSVRKVNPMDEHIIDSNIPTGDTPEEVTKRWAYINNKYEGDNVTYLPAKGE